MIFGAITNSWQQQLSTQALATLVEKAKQRGARHIELRATCLGDCERGDADAWRPVLPNLQALVGQFPDLSFNLAVPFPCLTETIDPEAESFQAALAAAQCVGREMPHLRLVDGSRFDRPWGGPGARPDEALGLVDLAREAARHELILSVENVGQPLRSLAMLVQEVCARVSLKEGSYLGLCPDPINQLSLYPDSDPLSELAAIPLDMLKIVHVKQTRDHKPYPTVDTGDLDCRRMLEVLEAMPYEGPLVFEIPPHERALENLTASFAFWRSGSD